MERETPLRQPYRQLVKICWFNDLVNQVQTMVVNRTISYNFRPTCAPHGRTSLTEVQPQHESRWVEPHQNRARSDHKYERNGPQEHLDWKVHLCDNRCAGSTSSQARTTLSTHVYMNCSTDSYTGGIQTVYLCVIQKWHGAAPAVTNRSVLDEACKHETGYRVQTNHNFTATVRQTHRTCTPGS